MHQAVLLLARYAYLGLLVGVAAENAGVPFPGEILVLLVAATASQAGLNFFTVFLVTVLGATVGDHGSYLIGRRGGRHFVNTYCRLTLCSHDCEEKANRFFHRSGVWMVTLARFVPGVGTFATPFAGMSRMPYRKFLIADLIGATLWAACFTLLGSELGAAMAGALDQLIRLGGMTIAAIMVCFALMIAMRVWRVGKYGILTVSADMAEPRESLKPKESLASAASRRP
jgi:membrane protein DedA with SNARE-associated domain